MAESTGEQPSYRPDEDAVIPARGTEWETPFSPVSHLNEDVDAVVFVPQRSRARGVIAILAVLATVAVIVGDIAYLAKALSDDTADIADRSPHSATTLVFGIRDAILLVATWMVVRWANQPIVNAPIRR